MTSDNKNDDTEMQSPGETAPPEQQADIDERLAEAEREAEQFKRLAQRAQADLVNFRNRVRNEQEALQARTAQRVAGRFIEIADQMEKALEPATASGADSQWVAGVEAIYQNLLTVLKTEGFERYEAVGEDFDPRRHEALLSSPSADHRPNSVISQVAAGYTRNGEVVRPAQVVIAVAPDADSTDGDEEGEPGPGAN